MPPARATALALLLGAAGLCGLWRGGFAEPVQAAACAASALALGLTALAERRQRPLRPGPAFLAPLLVLAVAGLQCLPLPAALLRLLSPVAWEIRALPPAPLPAFAPLTLDLPATLASLAPAAAVACALAAAGLLGRHQRARPLLLALPVAAALLQAGIALVRLASEGRLAGTFVNRNHLAALLVLGTLVALSAALTPAPPHEEDLAPPRSARVLWGAAGAACAVCALLTLSRGAAVSLAAGALFLLAAPRSRNRRRAGRWPRRLLLGGALAAAAGAAVALAPPQGLGRLLGVAPGGLTAEVKLRSFAGAARVALDHPLTGGGRGAWRLLSERRRSVPGELSFVFVENEPLQLAAEEGLPAALLVLLLAAAAFALAARRGEDGLARGALAGALALALHNLVDFNLAMPGVALPLAVAFGAAAAPAAGRGEGEGAPGPGPASRLERLRLPRAGLALLVACALGAAALPPALRDRQAERDADRLLWLAHDAATSAEALLASARAAVALHPADWLVSLAPAIGLHRRSPPRTAEALGWIGRAQQLAPGSWRPHAGAAAVLARAGRRSQARLEARLGLSADAALPGGALLELACSLSSTLDELLEVSPDDAHVRARLSEQLRVLKRPELALALADAELERLRGDRAPPPPGPLEELQQARAAALLDLGRLGEAEAQARALRRSSCEAAHLEALVGAARGDPAAAQEAALRQGLAACPANRALTGLLVEGRLRRGDAAGALQLLDEPAIGGPGVAWPAEVHLWRAQALEASGRASAALPERWFAAQRAPERPELGLDYAERLRAAGDLRGALEALHTLALQAPPEARAILEARLAALERPRR